MHQVLCAAQHLTRCQWLLVRAAQGGVTSYRAAPVVWVSVAQRGVPHPTCGFDSLVFSKVGTMKDLLISVKLYCNYIVIKMP